jgi:hypothetical protein
LSSSRAIALAALAAQLCACQVPQRLPPAASRSETYSAPYVSVGRAVEAAAVQAKLDLERVDPWRGRIVASRGGDAWAISMVERGPKQTEVTVSARLHDTAAAGAELDRFFHLLRANLAERPWE